MSVCGSLGSRSDLPANRDRTVEILAGRSEGRNEHWSVFSGQTKDIPRSARLTTYPGWAHGPMTRLRPFLRECSRSDAG